MTSNIMGNIMSNIIKKIALIATIIIIIFSTGLTGCNDNNNNSGNSSGNSARDNLANSAGNNSGYNSVSNSGSGGNTNNNIDGGTDGGLTNSTFSGGDPSGILRVFNATDYIDPTTIQDFEREFNIRVTYEEFDSNEEMYEIVSSDQNAYDVLVPSDYTIDRLIKEGMLAKINHANIPNVSFIAPSYLNPDYDPGNDYVVPYMTGTLGILYNKRRVADPVHSWTILWDTKYKGEILLWDSQRDVIGATLKMLGYSMNSNDDAELAQARERLISSRSYVQYASDEIYDKMIADEGALAIVYSGDAKTAIDQNPNLRYFIPDEGSNKWVDGFVIMKNTQNIDAAEKFINFMCRPNIAIRNMTKIGFTSPIPSIWSEFYGNPIMFPTDEALDRCESFLYNREATEKYTKLWADVR